MSKPSKSGPPSDGSAPAYDYRNAGDAMAMRAPPPTYEESQRNGGTGAGYGYPQGGAAPPSQNQYYGMISHQQQQMPFNGQQPNYGMHHGNGYGFAGPSTSAGAAAAQVLHLDSRAEVRTNATGNVVIPPPPPGCLPTPAQWAAMQGQPVVLKQKKRSFF
ncbi:DAZ-associated protein 2 [Drosophila subpulchrella]|uniref:DAZ-associated protein 2 n=1 Tax=Drosophila subpulchrella TaxID=1486046 RepID=UPI0018A13F84|nr:DAZ-associated protein 2 [Drosophila subpulchrella]